MADVVAGAVQSALEPHLDEDACEYVTSLLQDQPHDPDAREAVTALIVDSVDEEQHDAEQLCQTFFDLMDGLGNNNNKNNNNSAPEEETTEAATSLRKLDQAVTIKAHDIQTFASGLQADWAADDDPQTRPKQSQIAAFYANMIDCRNNPAAQSERARRKARQKELRERLEEDERQRAIAQAMALLEPDEEDAFEATAGGGSIDNSNNVVDVHLVDFDLPNLRGGGPPLLQNANLTLARGRRYGLMGRNGCGKTTLMSYIASRQVQGVPKNMSMLLVRQEIMGNEWTAVETVLKSDIQREAVKRFIAWCEDELEKLDGDENNEEKGKDETNAKKGRQKVRDRKRQAIQKAARQKAAAMVGVNQEDAKEVRRSKLSEKLAEAYQRMAQIDEDEGGDPEPRARKVLAGLGFSTEMQDKPTQELSGGWRMRVSLSCALFADPSVSKMQKFICFECPCRYGGHSLVCSL